MNTPTTLSLNELPILAKPGWEKILLEDEANNNPDARQELVRQLRRSLNQKTGENSK